MTKDKWVWMPHAGHLIVGNDCQFHLNTYVGGYIVSTVGEYWPDRGVREIHAEVWDVGWFNTNRFRKGDDFDSAYMKKFGYEEIGFGRTYETMVFKAGRDKENSCCPWTMQTPTDQDMRGYNTATDAYKGHLKLCEKWSKPSVSKGKKDLVGGGK